MLVDRTFWSSQELDKSISEALDMVTATGDMPKFSPQERDMNDHGFAQNTTF